MGSNHSYKLPIYPRPTPPQKVYINKTGNLLRRVPHPTGRKTAPRNHHIKEKTQYTKTIYHHFWGATTTADARDYLHMSKSERYSSYLMEICTALYSAIARTPRGGNMIYGFDNKFILFACFICVLVHIPNIHTHTFILPRSLHSLRDMHVICVMCELSLRRKKKK